MPFSNRFVAAWLVALMLVLACDAGVPAGGEVEVVPPGEGGEGVGVEVVPPAEGGDGGSPSDAIFTWDTVHALDIRLSDEAIESLDQDPFTYVEGSVTFDEQDVDPVGVRLKGNFTFRPLDAKASFKVDFNRYVQGQTLLGIEQLTVNNNVMDCSSLREHLAYRAMATAGVHETRTAHAWVRVNEEDYGLYVLVETPDDAWLERIYEEPDGNLYDGQFVKGEAFASSVDFIPQAQDLFEQEEGTDVGREDIHLITDGIAAWEGDLDGHAKLGALVDWDQLLRVWAAEQWVGQIDGYWLSRNNYRVYFNPQSGRMEMLPWDMDNAFYRAADWGFDWNTPWQEEVEPWSGSGRLFNFCMQDPSCTEALREAAMHIADTLESADLDLRLEQMVELIEPHVAVDPRQECDPTTITEEQDHMREWLLVRSDEVRELWAP